MNQAEMLEWVEKATNEELLRKWRFAKIGDPFFQDVDVSAAVSKRLAHLRNQNPDEYTAISNRIGW